MIRITSSTPERRLRIDRRADEYAAAVATAGGPDDLLTPAQVARHLAKTEGWLAAGRTKGYGPPHIKLGKSVRYRRDALVEWLNERLHHSTAEYATTPGTGRPRTLPRCPHCGGPVRK